MKCAITPACSVTVMTSSRRNLTLSQANSQNAFTPKNHPVATVRARCCVTFLQPTGKFSRRGDTLFLPSWGGQTCTANSVRHKKRDLTLHFPECPHSERVSEDVVADLYPAFVLLLLPLCHLLSTDGWDGSVRWVCCLPARPLASCMWDSRHERPNGSQVRWPSESRKTRSSEMTR